MNCHPPASSVLEISQARKLERIAISFSRGPSQPRDWTLISCLAGRFFTTESPGKPTGVESKWHLDFKMYKARFLTHKQDNYKVQLGFLGGRVVKNLPANAENTREADSVPEWGRPPGRGNGNQLKYSCLEDSTDRGAWQATVHGVTKS